MERRGALYDDGTQNNLVTAAVVPDNFFDVLQPAPAVGRSAAVAILLATSLLATLAPAMRAVHVDPMLALRNE
jgi:ABC-type lipoprotein release transport system permease subunit